jgi:hypothetical protein
LQGGADVYGDGDADNYGDAGADNYGDAGAENYGDTGNYGDNSADNYGTCLCLVYCSFLGTSSSFSAMLNALVTGFADF